MAHATLPALSQQAVARLEARVQQIVDKPGDLITPGEYQEAHKHIDMRAVVASLPEGLTEEDLAGILRLAMRTECDTLVYGREFDIRAKRNNAPWLGRFNSDVWVPDELGHTDPFKQSLMAMGISEEQLDSEIKEVQEIPFEHKGGESTTAVTTFGVVQEYLTDNWHGLIADLLEPAAPKAAAMARRVKRRETLHTMWYRDMTAIQIEDNPLLWREVALGVIKFEMPGNQLAPDLEAKVGQWLPTMGGNYERIFKDLVRHLSMVCTDSQMLGQMVIKIAAAKGFKMKDIDLKYLDFAVNRLGAPGAGIIGEALLQKMGLDKVFMAQKGAQDPVYQFYTGPAERIRAIIRDLFADWLEIDFGVTKLI